MKNNQSKLEKHLTTKRKENGMSHQHVMNCIEFELLNAKDGDEIRINVQGDKADIWNGNIYTGRHLFREIESDEPVDKTESSNEV